MKKLFYKFIACICAFALITTVMPVNAFAAGSVPSEIKRSGSNFGYDFKITFNESDQEWISSITAVYVSGEEYQKAAYSSQVWNNKTYYADESSRCLYIGEGGNFKDGKAECIVKAEGCPDLTLELNKNDHSAAIKTSAGPTETVPQKPDVSIEKSYGFGNDYLIFAFSTNDYVNGISEITVNGNTWQQQLYKIGLNGSQYYKDVNDNKLYFVPVSQTPLKSGDIMTIKNPSYADIQLKITIANGEMSIKPVNEGDTAEDEYALHVRLTGSFESALVKQKGYDAISSASTNVTQNKNSNARVEAVLLPKGQEPVESDWKPLSESGIRVNSKKTFVNIDSASGMQGVYSTSDSSVTLAGTPENAGVYPISVSVTDDQGRTAVSNSLNFCVYDENEEFLSKHLDYSNCTQTQDGKYMYDMNPWKIKNFSRTEESVTVPKDIKAWYGSHTSGTYGELGYAIKEGSQTTQTLVIPEGCNLTFVNMNILSSVHIIVENGGTLALRDSTVQGIVDIKAGGSFSMNYDNYNSKFLNGASVNGQIILNDGAVITDSKIYSNTNYIPNGSEARHNTKPVLVVNGNVELKGKVFLRGDEAPTGTDPATGISYTGQAGIQVNGTLNLDKDAVLAVYGGGKDATTSNGADAVILDNGSISGEGKLIAVGGNGSFGNGGNAVTGTGSINVLNAYLAGGNSYFPKKNSIAGKAVTDGITLSGRTNRNLCDGRLITHNDEDNSGAAYWRDITTEPDLTLYPVDNNAPGEKTETSQISGSYETISSWGNYVLGKVTITNVSEKTLKSWSIAYSYDGEVTNLWGAQFDSQENDIVKVSAPLWSRNLSAGDSASFYFIAELKDSSDIPEPKDLMLTSEEQKDSPSVSSNIDIKRTCEWAGGYTGNINIQNTSDKTIHGWTVEFDYEDEITAIWGGKIVSHEGTHYIITNAGYNSEISQNQNIQIGFCGKPADNKEYSDAQIKNYSMTSVVKKFD